VSSAESQYSNKFASGGLVVGGLVGLVAGSEFGCPLLGSLGGTVVGAWAGRGIGYLNYNYLKQDPYQSFLNDLTQAVPDP